MQSLYLSRFSLYAALAMGLSFASPLICNAQTQTESTDSHTSAGLNRRVEDLEKQLADLKAEIAAGKKEETPTSASAATTGAPAQSFVSQPGATAPPGPPTIASLLGPTSLSGFVDLYYNYNSNQPASRTNGFRSFDTGSNQFALNLVELVVDKAPDASASRTGYHVALGFGQAINAVNGSDPAGLGFDQYLKEAYFSYLAPVGKGLQIDAGKFVTPHGAEVIETKDNWNYSRGLLFSYAIPYFHYGLRAKYAFNDKYSLTGFVVNGWNNVVENNTGKTYGLSLGWNPNKRFGFVQNYMAGPELSNNNSNWRQLWDTVVTYSPTSKLSFMANYDYGHGDRVAGIANPVYWTGVAGYVKYVATPKYTVAARYEYYDDRYGFTTATPQTFNEVTGTLERTIASHILSRLEFRHDSSDHPTFLKGNSIPVSSQNTMTAGVVFMFDTREAK
ncbi:MAG: hypothetical protein QOD84_2758 [Acidobacteriaceae bacterium]|jgi:hypothetical protein